MAPTCLATDTRDHLLKGRTLRSCSAGAAMWWNSSLQRNFLNPNFQYFHYFFAQQHEKTRKISQLFNLVLRSFMLKALSQVSTSPINAKSFMVFYIDSCAQFIPLL